MTDSNKVYALISVSAYSDKHGVMHFSTDTLGVYKDLEKAMNFANDLEEITPSVKGKEVVYDILEFTVDEKPIVLSYLTEKKKLEEDTTEEIIINLMKQGYVDQLVGEDGHFYYKLTDQGKKTMKNIPSQIKKFFGK